MIFDRDFNPKQRFGIRKLTIGVCSVLLSTLFIAANNPQIVHAGTEGEGTSTPPISDQQAQPASTSGESEQEKAHNDQQRQINNPFVNLNSDEDTDDTDEDEFDNDPIDLSNYPYVYHWDGTPNELIDVENYIKNTITQDAINKYEEESGSDDLDDSKFKSWKWSNGEPKSSDLNQGSEGNKFGSFSGQLIVDSDDMGTTPIKITINLGTTIASYFRGKYNVANQGSLTSNDSKNVIISVSQDNGQNSYSGSIPNSSLLSFEVPDHTYSGDDLSSLISSIDLANANLAVAGDKTSKATIHFIDGSCVTCDGATLKVLSNPTLRSDVNIDSGASLLDKYPEADLGNIFNTTGGFPIYEWVNSNGEPAQNSDYDTAYSTNHKFAQAYVKITHYTSDTYDQVTGVQVVPVSIPIIPNESDIETENGGYDPNYWGQVDVSKWTVDGSGNIRDYKGDKTKPIIIPNAADFQKAGKHVDQVSISADVMKKIGFQSPAIGISKTDGKKVIATGNNWSTSGFSNYSNLSADPKYKSDSKLEKADLENLDVSNITDFSHMFYKNIPDSDTLKVLKISSWDTSSATDMNNMFANNTKLSGLDVSNWKTGKVTNMASMFSSDESLNNLDVSKWDTSNVTDMREMFYAADSLTNLDVSKWNVSKVTNMERMFWDAEKLEALDVSKWDPASLADALGMFKDTALNGPDIPNLKLTLNKDSKFTQWLDNYDLEGNHTFDNSGIITTDDMVLALKLSGNTIDQNSEIKDCIKSATRKVTLHKPSGDEVITQTINFIPEITNKNLSINMNNVNAPDGAVEDQLKFNLNSYCPNPKENSHFYNKEVYFNFVDTSYPGYIPSIGDIPAQKVILNQKQIAMIQNADGSLSPIENIDVYYTRIPDPEPAQPSQATKPVEPEQPTTPNKPNKPNKPTQPAKPHKPIKGHHKLPNAGDFPNGTHWENGKLVGPNGEIFYENGHLTRVGKDYLPQTGEKENNLAAIFGALASGIGLLGLLGERKKKDED